MPAKSLHRVISSTAVHAPQHRGTLNVIHPLLSVLIHLYPTRFLFHHHLVTTPLNPRSYPLPPVFPGRPAREPDPSQVAHSDRPLREHVFTSPETFRGRATGGLHRIVVSPIGKVCHWTGNLRQAGGSDREAAECVGGGEQTSPRQCDIWKTLDRVRLIECLLCLLPLMT